MKSDKVYCEYIISCIDKVGRFTSGMKREDFLASELVQSAVILQLLLIGELSKNLSSEFKKSTDLPWTQISGFRNRAIHNYYELELEFVWFAVQNDLVPIKEAVSK